MAKQETRTFTREEVLEIFGQDTPENIASTTSKNNLIEMHRGAFGWFPLQTLNKQGIALEIARQFKLGN